MGVSFIFLVFPAPLFDGGPNEGTLVSFIGHFGFFLASNCLNGSMVSHDYFYFMSQFIKVTCLCCYHSQLDRNHVQKLCGFLWRRWSFLSLVLTWPQPSYGGDGIWAQRETYLLCRAAA